MNKDAKILKGLPEEEEDFVPRWQNPALQADLVLERVRALYPKLSSIELSELSIPGKSCIFIWSHCRKSFCGHSKLGITITKSRGTQGFPWERHQNLGCYWYVVLADFDFSTPVESCGTPHTIVLSPAAQRVADLTRYYRIISILITIKRTQEIWCSRKSRSCEAICKALQIIGTHHVR